MRLLILNTVLRTITDLDISLALLMTAVVFWESVMIVIQPLHIYKLATTVLLNVNTLHQNTETFVKIIVQLDYSEIHKIIKISFNVNTNANSHIFH